MLSVIGRLLFVAIFLGSAFEKFSAFDPKTGGATGAEMAPRMDDFIARVEAQTGFKIPITKADYPTLILIAGAQEALGGLLFLLNFKLGSVILLSFMLPTSFIMHNFWDAPNEQVWMADMVNFMKNLSIIGALVMHLASSSRASGRKAKYD